MSSEEEMDAGPQLERVLRFKKELESSHEVMYRTFDGGSNAFKLEISNHLKAYVKGSLPK